MAASHSPSNQGTQTQIPATPPSQILDDWQLIDYILRKSNLAGLKLQDIIHHLNDQKALVQAIEPVARLDLLQSFLESVAFLETREKNPCQGWDICFHGTSPENVPSIIQHGFRIPEKNGHKSRFLWNWGPGIYCSPYGTYGYTYGQRWRDGEWVDEDIAVTIFVCAVARGRPYQCTMKRFRQCDDGLVDSHLSRCQNEWILLDEKRIVPLCLLWVKKGIPQKYGPAHERVQPGLGDSQDGASLRKPELYRFQNLRESMDYSGANARHVPKKVWQICSFRAHRTSSNTS